MFSSQQTGHSFLSLYLCPCCMLYVKGGEGREKISEFHLRTHPTQFERRVVDLYAGCYPIMPCRCTRPYSPRVFLNIVCLSAPRCISKRERKWEKEEKKWEKEEYVYKGDKIFSGLATLSGSITSRCSGEGPALFPWRLLRGERRPDRTRQRRKSRLCHFGMSCLLIPI